MKYRGWDRNIKKFIYNFVITPNGVTNMLYSNDELNSIINEYYYSKGDDLWGDYAITKNFAVTDGTDWYGINDVEVMMCTEINDKNNILIFENDYVEYMGKFYYVKFKRGSFLLENENEEIWWHQLNVIDIESSMIILGNIYEQRKTKLNLLKNIE